MPTLQLKTGQVAAVVGIPAKQVQNDVDAGYVEPTVVGQGRGSVRLFSLENVVHLTVLDLLVQAYGLDRQRAAAMLARVWPPRFTKRVKVLQMPPAQTTRHAEIPLEPLRLPLGAIIAATEQRITQVLTTYGEKKRGRSAGWSQDMHQALADVALPLQKVSDTQLQEAISTSRATKRRRTPQGTPL